MRERSWENHIQVCVITVCDNYIAATYIVDANLPLLNSGCLFHVVKMLSHHQQHELCFEQKAREKMQRQKKKNWLSC